MQRSKRLRSKRLVIKFTREINTNPDIFKNKEPKQEKINIWIPWKYMKNILINELDKLYEIQKLIIKKVMNAT